MESLACVDKRIRIETMEARGFKAKRVWWGYVGTYDVEKIVAL